MRVTVGTYGSRGIFDPSLTFDPETKRLWMSYSAADPSTRWPQQNVQVITTRIAYSTDSGSSWTDIGTAVNPTVDVEIDSAAKGTWHHEVSRLIYDPYAHESARWRLMWHHYLVVNQQRRFEHGWIGYKEAATPEGLVAAAEHKLFAGVGYHKANDSTTGPTSSPLGGAPLIALPALHQNMRQCAAATEPGLIATKDAVYLALVCADGANERATHLLRCAQPCRATAPGSWAYVTTILRNSDAVGLGYLRFTAPDLVEANGRYYAIASPEGDKPFADAYNGCAVFEFANLAKGELTPKPVKTITGSPDVFTGACTYHVEHRGGVIYGELHPNAAPDVARLFTRGVHIP